MFPSRFRYEAPHSLDEAIALLSEGGDDAKVLAGGQSLVPMMKLRFASPALLVDINNLPGLAYHKEATDGTLRIGALCRHSDLEFSEISGAPSRQWRRRRRSSPTPSCATGARSSARCATPTRRATGRP